MENLCKLSSSLTQLSCDRIANKIALYIRNLLDVYVRDDFIYLFFFIFL